MEINDTTFKVVVMMLVSHTAALWYIFSRCVLRIYYDEEVFLLCFPPGLLVFLHLSFLTTFLQLVFQALISAQTGSLLGTWQPSGFNY